MQKSFNLIPHSYHDLSAGHTALSGIIIDAAGEKIACKFYPVSSEDVTHADMFVTVVGDCSGITFTLQIETDSSDAPSGSVVGAASAAFAGPNVAGGANQWLGGGTNPIALGASCTVSLNTPYWLVLSIASGTPDATHSINLRGNFAAAIGDYKIRHHNGTNWTTTTSSSMSSFSLLKYNSGRLQGFPVTAAGIRSATAPDIFVNSGVVQVQGLRLKFGCQIRIPTVFVRFTKTGTPNDLTCTVYEENTARQTATIATAALVSVQIVFFQFSNPVWLSPNKNINFIFSQTGTSDSHDYDIYTSTTIANYITAFFTSGQGFIYGNLGNPEDLTLSTTEVPYIFPTIEFLESDISMPTSIWINVAGVWKAVSAVTVNVA